MLESLEKRLTYMEDRVYPVLVRWSTRLCCGIFCLFSFYTWKYSNGVEKKNTADELPFNQRKWMWPQCTISLRTACSEFVQSFFFSISYNFSQIIAVNLVHGVCMVNTKKVRQFYYNPFFSVEQSEKKSEIFFSMILTRGLIITTKFLLSTNPIDCLCTKETNEQRVEWLMLHSFNTKLYARESLAFPPEFLRNKLCVNEISAFLS